LELHTGDLASACDFYAQLCGWLPQEIDTGCGSYLALGLSGGIGGGIVECNTQRPLWLPYVEVDAIAEATEQAQRLGARCCSSPGRAQRVGAASSPRRPALRSPSGSRRGKRLAWACIYT